MGVLAILQALEHRQRTGEGQYIDLSETETMCSMLGTAVLEYGCNGKDALPVGNSSMAWIAAPHGVYCCKGEDRWCAIAVFNDEEWRAFCRVIGCPSWTMEARFASQLGRWQNADELDAAVESWTKLHTAEEVMDLLLGVGVAVGVVQNAADLANDPQLRSRGFFIELEHSVMGKTVSDGSPIKLSDTPAVYARAAPMLGQDNDYVYHCLLGISKEELQRLAADGVVR
jgi:crotonobetainyl-CoA:carnitine CoA-transferase CaiB-like acyl-CoA transferase